MDPFAERVASARLWYARSAAKGDLASQHNLGFMYAEGLGVAVDLDEAKRLYALAAAKGHKRAKAALAELVLSEDFDWDTVLLDEWSLSFNGSRPLQLTGRVFNNSQGFEEGDVLELSLIHI